MKSLHISNDLALPLDAVTQKLAFLGRTGSGKTFAAMKLAELMLSADAQVVVLDQVGPWHGLRMGDNPFAIPVFGGLHGDVPLEPTAGSFIADLIVDRSISVVLDVSQMLPAELQRFCHDFGARFFQRKKASPSAVHVILEECQEVVPQNPMGAEDRTLHVWQRIQKLGRNFGIGVSLISQRPQEVNKKALNQTECVFAFQMTGPQERKALALWVQEKGYDVDVQALLPKLAVGHAHVWSPQWLDVSKTVLIAPKRTPDVSSTPKVGARAKVRTLSSIDLKDVREAMTATIERAKQDDPKELRKRIAELERLSAVKPRPVPRITRQDLVGLDAMAIAVHGMQDALKNFRARMIVLAGDGDDFTPSEGMNRTKVLSLRATVPTSRRAIKAEPSEPQQQRSNGYEAGQTIPGHGAYVLRLLETMVQREPMKLTRAQLSTLSGRSRRSSAFAPAISTILSTGLARKVGADQFEVTDAGRALVPSDRRAPASTEDVIAQWRAVLPAYERAFFDVVVDAFPRRLTRDALAQRTGKSLRSSAFRPAISSLVKQGLAIVDGDEISASAELFQ